MTKSSEALTVNSAHSETTGRIRTRRRSAETALVALFWLCVASTPALAQVTLVSNTGQGTASPNQLVSNSTRQAVGFTTGDNEHGYTLTSVELVFTNWGTGDRAEITIRAESSGVPGTVLQTLVSPRTITNNSTASFTTSDTLTLESNTTYFVVSRASAGWFLVRTTNSNAEDSGGQAGWSLHNRAHTTSSAVPQWTQSVVDKKTKVTIKGIVNQAANAAATGAPTISGAAAEGQTLSVARGTVADTDGLPSTTFPEGYSVQWLRIEGGIASVISGATATSYTLQNADLRKRVSARVSFTDGAGHTETRTSGAYPPDPFTVENPLAVDSAASGYYADASLSTTLSGTQMTGTEIYLKVVHNEKLSHTAGDGADARPEIFYKIGDGTAVRFDIVDHGTALESGDCKPKVEPISPPAAPSASTAPAHRRSIRLSPNPRPAPLRPCPDCARGCTTAPLRLASGTPRPPSPS